VKPTFIGIGAQKCATTWLYRILEDHPEAALSQPKELHFFSANYDRGYRWYEAHFPAPASARVVGEYSTSYLCSRDAAERARCYDPTLRILVALRDPVERAYSNHLHELRAGHLGAAPLAFESCVDDNPMYLEQGLYARHLRRWLARFPREQVHVVFQEHIEQDPVGQAAALYRFLGIDPSHRSPYVAERVNTSVLKRSAHARRLMQWTAGSLRKAFGDQWVRSLKVAPGVSRLRAANDKPLKDVVLPMQDDTRRHLVAHFTSDMRELAQMLDLAELPWRSWREAVT